MRQFTDAEKQQLEAKIKDEQERQIQIVKELVQRNDGAPPKKSTAAKYVYLGFFLCMLALQAFTFILLIGRNLGFYQLPIGLRDSPPAKSPAFVLGRPPSR